jgi:hypothetical protein
MTTAVTHDVAQPAASAQAAWLIPIAVFIVAVVSRAFCAQNVDVSGLLTWADKMLDGAKPYVDFIELNPPGSFLIYIPGAVLGRWFGVAEEVMVEATVFALMAGSLYLCWLVARPSQLIRDIDLAYVVALVIGILSILPARTFGEREHIGVIALLPLLMLCAARFNGYAPTAIISLSIGFFASIATIAKPHLVLIPMFAVLFVCVGAQSLRRAFDVEWLAFSASNVVYLVAIWFAFPEFFSFVLPLVMDVYVASRADVYLDLLQLSAVLWIFVTGALFLLISKKRHLTPLLGLLVGASLVGWIIVVVQGKGWPYHTYPLIAFMLLAFALRAVHRLYP